MRMITTVISQSWPLLCVSVCCPIRPGRHWGVSDQCRSGLGARPALVSNVGVWENFKERGGIHHKVKKPLFKKFFCSSPPLTKVFTYRPHMGAIRNMRAIRPKNTIVILENFHGVVVYIAHIVVIAHILLWIFYSCHVNASVLYWLSSETVFSFDGDSNANVSAV